MVATWKLAVAVMTRRHRPRACAVRLVVVPVVHLAGAANPAASLRGLALPGNRIRAFDVARLPSLEGDVNHVLVFEVQAGGGFIAAHHIAVKSEYQLGLRLHPPPRLRRPPVRSFDMSDRGNVQSSIGGLRAPYTAVQRNGSREDKS